MTKEELAALLNGREYGSEITKEEAALAKAAGLLVCFGYSDDNTEFEGVIHDEAGAGESTVHEFNSDLRLIERMDPREERDLVNKGWTRPRAAFTVTAQWCPADLGTSWRITSDQPFAPFDIMEGADLYCRGCVIDAHAALKPSPLQTPDAGEGK